VSPGAKPVGSGPPGQRSNDPTSDVAGKAVPVEEARISTVYDGDGRQRSAGLELWIDGEDFPRRCSGAVAAGSSLALDGLDVHAAVFRWRMEGRDGAGAYELWARARSEAA